MLQFNKKYFLLSILLFITELLIALFVHDSVIRLYAGDLLVVILIYCFVKSFLNIQAWPLATGVFIFACFIETLQYFKIVNQLGIQQYKLARIIIGTSFSWTDIVAYAAGLAIVLFFEQTTISKKI
jgi:hypothetical protein